MYGWRARIGLISPMPGENVEHAFHIYAPDGVSFSSMKMPFPGPTPEGLKILSGQLEDTASKYKGQDLDLIVFCCTSGSFIQGVGWDRECIQRIKQASGIPGLTTSTAVLESLNVLGARSLAVLTPYPDATNEAERKFLEDNGFEVRTILGMDMSGVEKGRIYNAEKPFLYRNSMKMDLKGADVFFLSCMNIRMFPESDRLLEAMKEKLDFFVDVDVFMTRAAEYADIVLPACTSVERSELKCYRGGYFYYTQPVIKPLYESKSDVDILCELANVMLMMSVSVEQALQMILDRAAPLGRRTGAFDCVPGAYSRPEHLCRSPATVLRPFSPGRLCSAGGRYRRVGSRYPGGVGGGGYALCRRCGVDPYAAGTSGSFDDGKHDTPVRRLRHPSGGHRRGRTRCANISNSLCR